jgi:hemoglobin
MKSSAITEETIRTLVDTFYTKVLKDPDLAPVFTAAIGTTKEEWQSHLARMYDFWSGVALGTARFNGNPMRAHLQLPPFDPALFDRWLALFAETAHETHEPEAAEHFIARSRRIADNLRRGLSERAAT